MNKVSYPAIHWTIVPQYILYLGLKLAPARDAFPTSIDLISRLLDARSSPTDYGHSPRLNSL
jgi:hypothetical protein